MATCTFAASTALLVTLATPAQGLVQGAWSDRTLDPAARAMLLVKNMTLDEKLLMLHGPTISNYEDSCNFSAVCAYVGNVAPNARLDIPPINMNDGPQVRPGVCVCCDCMCVCVCVRIGSAQSQPVHPR